MFLMPFLELVVGFFELRLFEMAGAFHPLDDFFGGGDLAAMVALFALRRMALERGWLSTISRAALMVMLAGYLVYLGWDDPVAPSIARNHAAMAGRCEDEATYRLTLRYTPAPGGGGKVFTAPTHKLDFSSKGEKRTAYLRAHRTDIEANWVELAEVRAWWAEMAAQPQLGDRPGTDFDQPSFAFSRCGLTFSMRWLSPSSMRSMAMETRRWRRSAMPMLSECGWRRRHARLSGA